MKINVINTYKEVRNYIERVQNGDSPALCWEEEVVFPYWDQLCCYAPFDLSERKPSMITDLVSLKKQCDLLEALNVVSLEKEFERVTGILPNYDDDPITVTLFPSDDHNATVNDKQNGVVGTSLFGNLFIQVNPLVPGYEDWIKYVFAHEYHHAVWGNYWFMMHGSELENQFIESLVIDGEADSFALSLYPALRPQWLFDLPEEEIHRLWEDRYREIANRTEVDYISYMFGNQDQNIPWCAGYAVGYQLVQNYLTVTGKTIVEILETKPEVLLKPYHA